MKKLLLVVVALTAAGAGCSGIPEEDSVDIWRVDGTDYVTVTQAVAPWATQTFARGDAGASFGSGSSAISEIAGDLRLVDSYEVRVIDIPEGRKIGDYGEPVEPSDFFVYVLEDQEGKIFRTFVQSFDGDTFRATSFGPALDRSTDVALDTWPAQKLQDDAEKDGARMVMIPYPYPMNQVYYQYGDNVATAKLVNVETGVSFQGLNDLLDSIEADWESLK